MPELELKNVYNPAILDSEDFDRFSRFTWYADKTGHVYGVGPEKGSGKNQLSRLILNAPSGMVVDHINGNPLDNRKENLRLCSQSDNCRNRSLSKNNTSGFKGINFKKSSRRWGARASTRGERIHLGYFECREDAAARYDMFVVENNGVYASPNNVLSERLKIDLRYKPTKFSDPHLTKGIVPLGNKIYALVSPEDYPQVMEHSWTLHSGGYAKAGGAKFSGYLHRFIMGSPPNLEIDHVNKNKLDCRRENLRVCTSQENKWNTRPRNKTSKYKGVSWSKVVKKWRSVIKRGGKTTTLGFFNKEAEAATAYDHTAKEFGGEFAYLNFPNADSSGFSYNPRVRSSVYRGVSKVMGKFLVRMRLDGHIKCVGSFFDEDLAALAYDNLARYAHGDKAKLNFSHGYPLPEVR